MRLDASNSGAWRLTGNAGTSPATNFLGTTDNQALVLRTNNLERVRILSSGLMGIGTASPTERLEVAGNIGLKHGASAFLGTLDDNNLELRVDNQPTLIFNRPGSPTSAWAIQRDYGGHPRGEYAVDFQIARDDSAQVASGANSFLGGGSKNEASGANSVVTGGHANRAANVESFVGGGISNQVTAAKGAIAGGSANLVSGFMSFIGGGAGNVVSGENSVIAGGDGNQVLGNMSAIPGGKNLILGHQSFGFNAASSPSFVNLSSQNKVAVFVDANLWLYNIEDTARQLRFYEPSGSGTNFTALRAQPQASNIIYTLPSSLTTGGLLQTDGAGNLSWVGASGLNNLAWTLIGNSGTSPTTNFLGTTDAVDLVFRTNNNERMRILSGGDVGIGTASPTHRLHVNGAVRAENGFLANDGTAGVPAYRFNSDTDVGMFRPAADQIGFAMTGVEKLRINGNAADALVGINNNSPSAPLDFVRTTSNSMLVGTNYGNAPNYDLRRAQGTPSSPTIIGANGVLARLRAFGYDGSAFQTAAQIVFETDAATGSGDMPGRIVFSTTPDGSATLAERMRISNNGIIRFNNYTANGVLVTSASDGTIQEVAPGAAGNILVSSGTAWTSGTGSGQFIQNQNATDQTANFRITGTGRANTSFQSPVYTRADAGTVAIRPNTNSTTAIQLQNAGGTSILNVDATNERVGIGTTTPGHVLHVIETGNSGSVHGIYINETNEGQALGIDEFGNGAGILINSNNEGSAIYSTVNGAVTSNAVGFFLYDNRTSSTPSITKIGADIQSTGTWSGSGSSNTGINLVASGGSTNVGINVSVSGGTTNYAGLFNGGNVGIGTTTPGGRVDINGSTTSNAEIALRVNNSGGPGVDNTFLVVENDGAVQIGTPPLTTLSTDNIGKSAITVGDQNVAHSNGGSGGGVNQAAIAIGRRSEVYHSGGSSASVAIGESNRIGTTSAYVNNSYALGSLLRNTQSNTLTLGMGPNVGFTNGASGTIMMVNNSTVPSLTVVAGDGSGTPGNVGIGLTTPLTPLHVHAPTTSLTFEITRFTNGTTGSAAGDGTAFGFANNGLNFYMDNKEGAGFQWWTSGTERMRLAGNGIFSLNNNNTTAYPPYNSNGGGAISWNFGAGTGEVSLWNNVSAGSPRGFSFRQMTSASSQTELMRVQGTGEIFGRFRHVTYHSYNNNPQIVIREKFLMTAIREKR